MPSRKIGLALGSGGARGFAHIAVIRRLREWGIPIACVSGTSIGAIIGAGFAAENFKTIESYAMNLDWKTALKIFLEARLPKNGGIITGTKVMRELRHLIPCARFSDLAIPFACVATDIYAGKRVVLDHGDLHHAIRASISIPGVFTPVIHDNAVLVDGGLVDALPVSLCRDLGATTVIGVDINLKASQNTPSNQSKNAKGLKLVDVLFRSFRFMENETTRAGLEANPPDVLIQPAVGQINALDFIHGCDEAYAAGLEAVDAARPAIMEILK